MAISDKQKLEIYDKLREMHGIMKAVRASHGTILEDGEDGEWEINALDAVDSVLYLAEGVFAKMSD